MTINTTLWTVGGVPPASQLPLWRIRPKRRRAKRRGGFLFGIEGCTLLSGGGTC